MSERVSECIGGWVGGRIGRLEVVTLHYPCPAYLEALGDLMDHRAGGEIGKASATDEDRGETFREAVLDQPAEDTWDRTRREMRGQRSEMWH